MRRLADHPYLCLAFACGLATTNAQIRPAPPSSRDIKDAKAQCQTAAQFQPSHLETNAAILKTAESVASQMIGRYGADSAKQPDLTDQWGGLQLTILTAADPSCIATAVSKQKITSAATAQATTSQSNKQVGSPPSSDASTSPVQKVGVPQLLAVAVENGAVSNSVTGTTMTLSSSPYGFITAFRPDADTNTNYKRYGEATQIGASATFNVASSTNALASATRKQVSQWQVKWTFRDASVRSSDVNSLFTKDLQSSAEALVADASSGTFETFYRPLAGILNSVYIQSWETSLKPLVSQAPAANDSDGSQKAAGVARQLLQSLDTDPAYQKALAEGLARQTSGLTQLVEQNEADTATYQTQEALFERDVADLAKGWNGDILFGQRFPTTASTSSSTSASTASTTPHTPDYLLGEFDVACTPPSDGSRKCLTGSKTSVTGNFSTSFYTTPNPALNEKTLRGVQAAIQTQWNLGSGLTKIKSANDKSQLTFSVNGSYQRLQENKDEKGKRPDIVLGTIKFEIPISGGVALPFSFSVANATEQVKETFVKGDFGLTFDLDKLASLLKANQ